MTEELKELIFQYMDASNAGDKVKEEALIHAIQQYNKSNQIDTQS